MKLDKPLSLSQLESPSVFLWFFRAFLHVDDFFAARNVSSEIYYPRWLHYELVYLVRYQIPVCDSVDITRSDPTEGDNGRNEAN